jgi:hypothetical protein
MLTHSAEVTGEVGINEAYVTADGFPIKFGAREGSRNRLKLLIWRHPV